MKINSTSIGYLNENFRFFHIKDQQNLEFDYHHHDFMKIVILIEGDLTYFIEGKSYILKPWDILLINENEIHKPVINPSKVYERIVIWINPKFLQNIKNLGADLSNCFTLSSQNKFNLIRLNMISLENIKNIINKIQSCDNDNEFASILLKDTLFIEFLIMINRCYIRSSNNNTSDDVIYDKLVDDILDFINSNLTHNLSIDIIANKFFTSKYYLMRRFKAITGSSIHNYIVQKRLILAKSLINEGFSMSDACINSGFNDYSNFVRAFKKNYGVSPKHYFENKNSVFSSEFYNE